MNNFGNGFAAFFQIKKAALLHTAILHFSLFIIHIH
jgi:hypothetical protein